MGLYSEGLIIGRCFASENWGGGCLFSGGLFFGGGDLLSEFYGMLPCQRENQSKRSFILAHNSKTKLVIPIFVIGKLPTWHNQTFCKV